MAQPLTVTIFLALFTASIAGCRSTGCRSTEHANHSDRAGGSPHEPHPVMGGFLLQTGHIQLGPRTGQNAVRWLGDGQNWLEFSGGSSTASTEE